MDDWLTELAQSAPLMPYLVVFGTLLLSGFGLPLPEDIPLIIGGYLCGQGHADPYIMLPGAMLCILGADSLIFFLGWRYGHHIPKLPVLRRFLTPTRVRWAEQKLEQHGGKFIFVARFLPGARTAAFFAAGVFRVPFSRFIIYDGTAALISVPLIFGLALVFHAELNQAKEWIARAEITTLIILGLLIVGLIIGKRYLKKRLIKAEPGA